MVGSRKFDTGLRYETASDFFDLDGNVNMRLTEKAAIDVCKQLESEELVVMRIEGGIWWNPMFEARLDSIWDAKDALSPKQNIESAIAFIREESLKFAEGTARYHDAFLVTAIKSDDLDN